MSITELKEELAKVKKAKFYLECKDRWTCSDYKLSSDYTDYIIALEKKIKAIA